MKAVYAYCKYLHIHWKICEFLERRIRTLAKLYLFLQIAWDRFSKNDKEVIHWQSCIFLTVNVKMLHECNNYVYPIINDIIRLRFTDRLLITNECHCNLFCAALLRYFGAWGMWACSLFLSLWNSENTLTKFKNLLLQNHWANFNQTWHKASLCEGDINLFKWRAPPFSKGR